MHDLEVWIICHRLDCLKSILEFWEKSVAINDTFHMGQVKIRAQR